MFLKIVIIGGVMIGLTSLVQVVVNARLVTHLRRCHLRIYDSIGSPGIVWNKLASRNAVVRFVLSSQWADVNDPVLARLCWTYRAVTILHFAVSGTVLLAITGDMLLWLVS